MPTPFAIGHRLKFAVAGIAKVLVVFRLEKEEHSHIFVSVDKQLDPTRDGYPCPIRFLGRIATPEEGPYKY